MDWRILAACAVIIIAAFAWLAITNAELRAHLAMAKAENVALHISNDNFKADTEKQNRAVVALKTSALRRAQRAAIANKVASVLVGKYLADAAKIEKQRAGGDDCRAADDLIDTYISAIK